jgi:hypothetical protein
MKDVHGITFKLSTCNHNYLSDSGWPYLRRCQVPACADSKKLNTIIRLYETKYTYRLKCIFSDFLGQDCMDCVKKNSLGQDCVEPSALGTDSKVIRIFKILRILRIARMFKFIKFFA